jgi:hypothetical protein
MHDYIGASAMHGVCPAIQGVCPVCVRDQQIYALADARTDALNWQKGELAEPET